jgi:uncharacterized protein
MGVPLSPPRFDSDLMRPFYDGLAKGELRLTACSECGKWYWYPPDVLPCHPHAPMKWRPVSSTGSIYTFTEVRRSLLPGRANGTTPYTVLLVEPDDVPRARIPGLFVAPNGIEPLCGGKVTLKPVQAGDCLVAGFWPVE